MGILESLISLLIFSLPLGVVFKLSPFPTASLYIYDFLAGLIFLFVIFKILSSRKKIEGGKLLVLILLFILVGFISLLINSGSLNTSSFLVSFGYILRFASYSSIIFAVQLVDDDFKKTINKKLIITGVIFAFLGYVQYFFYPNLRNLYYAGWDEHLGRLFSTFLDPNFAGSFLVLNILLMSGNIIDSYKKRNLNLPLAGIWIAFFIAILLTYSRSAFIMLIIGFSSLLILSRYYKLLILSILIFILAFFFFSDRNIEGLNPFRIASVEARLDSAKDALYIIGKNPVIGVGFNAYRYAQVRYGLREEKGSIASHADAGTDNTYLFVLATTGIIGFLIYLDLWINIIKVIVRNFKSLGVFGKVVLSSIIAILINTLFINSLFYPPIMAWIFLLVGLTVSRRR